MDKQQKFNCKYVVLLFYNTKFLPSKITPYTIARYLFTYVYTVVGKCQVGGLKDHNY